MAHCRRGSFCLRRHLLRRSAEALCQDGYVAVKDENGSFVVGKDPAKTFVAQIGDRSSPHDPGSH